MANQIKELVTSAIDSLEGMLTSESVIGEAVSAPDGTMIIPITKVSFGVGGGGSEFKEKNSAGENLFGGGMAAGASVKPEGFLVITKKGSVRFVAVNERQSSVEKLIDFAPDIVDRVSGVFKRTQHDHD